jgi:hypothetical protein
MPLNVKEAGTREFKRAPAGVHVAVCNLVVDCGVQPGGKYKPRHQVYIRWELPKERIQWTDKEGEQHEGPITIGRFYTASLGEKATLRRDLENWRGRAFTKQELAGFNLFNILGAACQLMVVQSTVGDEIYSNVAGVMGFPKDHPKPTAENTLLKYSPDESEQLEQLPRWLRDKVLGSLAPPEPPEEYAKASGDDFDDDIPF